MQQTAEQPKVKIPAEAVELYTQFIHGEISRRDFMDTVGRRFAVTGLTAAAIVEALTPNYALGQQVRKDDQRIKATYETIPSPMGNGYIKGYFVRPFSQDTRAATPTKLPCGSRQEIAPATSSSSGAHRGGGETCLTRGEKAVKRLHTLSRDGYRMSWARTRFHGSICRCRGISRAWRDRRFSRTIRRPTPSFRRRWAVTSLAGRFAKVGVTLEF